MEQNRDLNPCIYDQLIYDRGARNIKWGKDSIFNKWCWENWTAIFKRFLLMFSSKSFMVSCLKFECLIHFEFTLCVGLESNPVSFS